MQLALSVDAEILVRSAQFSKAAVPQSTHDALSTDRPYPVLHSLQVSVPLAVHVRQLVGHSEVIHA